MRLKSVLFSLAVLLVAGIANAQATRTWVSGVGNDANPCSLTAPCKTFAGAMSKTASPGIIDCLDGGGFGAVTITKDITIDCTGTQGSILASGVQGVVVSATSSQNVVLRNININGAGVTIGTNAINFTSGKSLTLEGVYISTFSADGVHCSSSNAMNLDVHESTIQHTFVAVNLLSNCKAEIQHSYLNQNGSAAVFTQAATTDANVADSFLNNNNFGVSAGTNSTIWLFGCQLSHNAQSVNTFGGGVVNSHGNNAIINNTTNIVPPNIFTN